MTKIIGNTTATPNPRPDWNQDDSTKADYIKNKPSILTEEDIINLIAEHGGGSGGGVDTNNTILWQPNTEYEVGDIVIYIGKDIDTPDIFVKFVRCVQKHTSTNVFNDDYELNDCWESISVFQSASSVIAENILSVNDLGTGTVITGQEIYELFQDLPGFVDEVIARDERLKYYGDPDVVPSDNSLFDFITDYGTMTAIAYIKTDLINAVGIRELVIPYRYEVDGKIYTVIEIRNETGAEITCVERVFIPNTVKTIGEYAFFNFINLNEVHISNGVEVIDEYAFRYCEALREVNLPDSVTRIALYAFSNCENLKKVRMPYGLKRIEACAFLNDYSLTELTIPDSVTLIGGEFIAGTLIQEIRIPNGVTSIGAFTFRAFHGVEVIVPDNVTRIDGLAFAECSKLQSIRIPKEVTDIDWSGYGSIIYNCDNIVTIQCYKNSVAEEYCITNNIPYELLDIDIVTNTPDAIEDVITLVLKPEQELRLGTLTGAYTLSLPQVIPKVYESYWTFTAGDDLSLTYSGTPIVWRGDDVDNEGIFTPITGTSYEIALKKINDDVIVARVGAF